MAEVKGQASIQVITQVLNRLTESSLRLAHPTVAIVQFGDVYHC